MKTERVTLKDCQFTLHHYEGTGLDGCVIDIKPTELSQIQRLLATLGGRIDIFNTTLELSDKEPEILTWISYYHNDKVSFFASLNITLEQYHLMLAGLGGNNSVTFGKPTKLTMIDDSYFVMPEDRTNILAQFRESQSSAITMTKE